MLSKCETSPSNFVPIRMLSNKNVVQWECFPIANSSFYLAQVFYICYCKECYLVMWSVPKVNIELYIQSSTLWNYYKQYNDFKLLTILIGTQCSLEQNSGSIHIISQWDKG